MAIKYQFNKTSLQALEKNLKMRQRTLPIIKSKETALRLEVKKCKDEAEVLEDKLQQQIEGYESMYALWGEFDASLVSLKGTRTPAIFFSPSSTSLSDTSEASNSPHRAYMDS